MLPHGLCPLTIRAALARTVALVPDVEAVVAGDGRVTYAQLADGVGSLAAALAASGIRPGDRVGMCLPNGVRWVELFLALGSVGAVAVPINTRFRQDEFAFACRHSRLAALFTVDRFLGQDFAAMLRAIGPVDGLRQLVVLGTDLPDGAVAFDAWRMGVAPMHGPATPGPAPPGPATPDPATPDDLLLMQYTSGTTSFPKGVLLTHANMLGNAFVSGCRIGLRAGDRFHSARPFFHVSGSTLSVLACLQHGVTLVTMDRFDAAAALRLMEDERCTHFSGNDTMALMLLNDPSRADRRLHLRGAWAAASPTVLARIVDELGATECVAGYGLSESSPNIAQSCWWEPLEIRTAARMRPQPGLAVEVRGPDNVALAPGEAGEITVRGWTVMRGYFDRPEETAATLDAAGWLRTGDLGRLGTDGRLEFLGRLRDIVRVGGENVSPAEVEDVLHRHPAIRQAAVVGVPDPRLQEIVVAFVILNDGANADAASIMAWAQANMAKYKAPRHVWVVDAFEGMTASSKIQKKPMAAQARRLLGLDA